MIVLIAQRKGINMKEDLNERFGRVMCGVTAGALFGNIGWLIPSTIKRGGENVVVIMMFLIIGLLMLITSLFSEI
jgi:hypothetical protein